MDPTFTVVMPAYNAVATVGAAIRSVLAQTRGDFELLVVDDGSSDETAAAVQPFTAADTRVRLLRGAHSGPSAARNVALAAARGRYVSMLDSDDLWVSSYLAVMGAALDAHPRAALAYTDAWVLDDATGRIQRVTAMHYQHPPDPPPPDADAFLALLVQRNFIFSSATLRRTVIEDVGPYDASLNAAVDYELWLRIVARRHRVIRPPGILAVYRKRPGSVSTDELRVITNLRVILERVAEHGEVSDAIRRLARDRVGALDECLTRDRRALRVSYRARLRLIELYRALAAPWLWHRATPSELQPTSLIWASGG